MTGWAIDRLREMDVAEPVVADLGTGSGAIALAIAQEVPRARVHAVEADPLAGAGPSGTSPGTWTVPTPPAGCCCTRATSVARRARPSRARRAGTVDLVITNPPYIPVGSSCRPRSASTTRPPRCGAARRLDAIRRSSAPPGGCCARRPGRRRARRAAGRRGVLGVPEESGWRDTQPQGPGRAGPVRHGAWPGPGSSRDGSSRVHRHGDERSLRLRGTRSSGTGLVAAAVTPCSRASWSCCRRTRSTASARTPSPRRR
jgi:hypothetical protein